MNFLNQLIASYVRVSKEAEFQNPLDRPFDIIPGSKIISQPMSCVVSRSSKGRSREKEASFFLENSFDGPKGEMNGRYYYKTKQNKKNYQDGYIM